jgi:hypothetical protein
MAKVKKGAPKAPTVAPASGNVRLVSTGIACITLGAGEQIPHDSTEPFEVTAAQAKRLIAKGYAEPTEVQATEEGEPEDEDPEEDGKEG